MPVIESANEAREAFPKGGDLMLEKDTDGPSPGSRQTLLGNLLTFAHVLRHNGMDITTGRIIDATRSISHIDIGNRDDFFNALKTNFVSSHEEIPRFERAFFLYWGTLRPDQLRQSSDDGLLLEESSQPEFENYSPDEVLATKDFSTYSDDQVRVLQQLMAEIAPRVATVVSRRTRADNRAHQIDPRRTLRRSMKYGGDIIDLARKRRRIKRTRIALLCDVSGSMDLYSKILIQFLYALQNEMTNVETLVFSTRLTRITSILRTRDIYSALDEIANKVKDWSGGTSVGKCLRSFNVGFGRSFLNSRTIVIIISDGVDWGEDGLLSQEMRHLARNSFKTIWLNPLLSAPNYRPQHTRMAPALPYIDFLLPAHNLNSLVILAKTLQNLSVA